MSKIYECVMIKEIGFFLKSESMDEAMDWMSQHVPDDVVRMTENYVINYHDEVAWDHEDNGTFQGVIDITEVNENGKNA